MGEWMLPPFRAFSSGEEYSRAETLSTPERVEMMYRSMTGPDVERAALRQRRRQIGLGLIDGVGQRQAMREKGRDGR